MAGDLFFLFYVLSLSSMLCTCTMHIPTFFSLIKSLRITHAFPIGYMLVHMSSIVEVTIGGERTNLRIPAGPDLQRYDKLSNIIHVQ